MSRVHAALRRRLGIAEALTLCLYIAALAWAIPHHEPWADEAQAWQIARSLSLPRMFHVLSYEGHPGLWYLFLWILTRLHLTYAGMHWVAAGIALMGVSVLVLTAPFPRWIRLLLPFTFYLAFQYAIVARSYVFAPLLLFLCAYLWPQRREKPWLVALCLGLLANVVLHTAVISGGLAIAWLIDLWRERHAAASHRQWKKLGAAAALLLALYVFAAWTAFPARDASGAGLVVRPNPQLKQWLNAQQSQLQPLVRPQPANRRSLRWLSWKVETRLAPGLTEGLIRPFWAGCVFWLLLSWKLYRNRKLYYLLAPLLFVIFSADVYAWFWHSGLMLPCVVAILWMTAPPAALTWRELPLYEQLPTLMLLLIVLTQISWATYAFRFDHTENYAPAADTAAFLKPYVSSHARIVEIGDDFLSVDLQPYFDQNIYENQPYPYYWWSLRNPGKLRYQEILREHPDIVILEWRFRQSPPPASEVAAIPLVAQLTQLGFHNTHTTCGGLVQPGRSFLEWDCEIVYQPDPMQLLHKGNSSGRP